MSFFNIGFKPYSATESSVVQPRHTRPARVQKRVDSNHLSDLFTRVKIARKAAELKKASLKTQKKKRDLPKFKSVALTVRAAVKMRKIGAGVKKARDAALTAKVKAGFAELSKNHKAKSRHSVLVSQFLTLEAKIDCLLAKLERANEGLEKAVKAKTTVETQVAELKQSHFDKTFIQTYEMKAQRLEEKIEVIEEEILQLEDEINNLGRLENVVKKQLFPSEKVIPEARRVEKISEEDADSTVKTTVKVALEVQSTTTAPIRILEQGQSETGSPVEEIIAPIRRASSSDELEVPSNRTSVSSLDQGVVTPERENSPEPQANTVDVENEVTNQPQEDILDVSSETKEKLGSYLRKIETTSPLGLKMQEKKLAEEAAQLSGEMDIYRYMDAVKTDAKSSSSFGVILTKKSNKKKADVILVQLYKKIQREFGTYPKKGYDRAAEMIPADMRAESLAAYASKNGLDGDTLSSLMQGVSVATEKTRKDKTRELVEYMLG